MHLSQFIRLYPLRRGKISWLFGAGTSVSAGIPTASDLVWEFKSKIYCSEQGMQLSLFNNLSDPALREQIQAYFDSKTNYPKLHSNEEYSFYFELAYPNPTDRSNFLKQLTSGMRNSFGHKVIGVLIKNDYISTIFTTNFDKAFENATFEEYKNVGSCFIGTLDNADATKNQYFSGFRPIIVKIHGDYFSQKLKNIEKELREQDETLRKVLLSNCQTNGLAIMGYSGRDKSVIQILNNALDTETYFPSGLFWFVQAGSYVSQEVNDLIEKAKRKGVEAEFIEIDTFDSAWGEIIKGITDLPKADYDKLNANLYRLSNAPLPRKGTKYPLIRLNAINITELPSTARLIKCEAGNTKEIKELIREAKSNILAIRKKNGIVGFGADSEFEKTFSKYGTLVMDVYHIPEKSLFYEDSSTKGIITEALTLSLVRNKPLRSLKKSDRYLIIPDPKKINDKIFDPFIQILDSNLMGKIPGTNIDWIIALEIAVQRKQFKFFMTMNPAVIAGKTGDDNERVNISPFIKEFTATWYNNKYPLLLDAWINLLFESKKDIDIYAFEYGITGFNPCFKLNRNSAISKTL